MTDVPNPGSPEAIAAGCFCPVFDNAHGKGCGVDPDTGEPGYWYTYGCPIHAPMETSE